MKDLEDAIVVQSFGYDSVDDYYERGAMRPPACFCFNLLP